MTQHFAHAHLPPHLKEVGDIFDKAAEDLCSRVPASTQRTEALAHIWEAKDLAVRAKVAATPSRPPQPSPEHVWDAFSNAWRLPSAKGPAIMPKTTAA